MRRLRRSVALALVAGTGLAAFTGVGSATASTDPQLHVVTTLPGNYVGPLQFAVSGQTVAVADGFASALYLVGHSAPIAKGPAPSKNPEGSGDVGGVAIKNGRIAYTTSTGNHADTRLIVLHHGKRVLNVNLAAYERRNNPDGRVAYGVQNPSTVPAACKAALAKQHAPLQYKGEKDSHPYAVAGLKDGSWLVADAGGNDVLHVSARGQVSTVSVLPAQPVKITAAVAAELKAPACAGITYRFESVPTDVEVQGGEVYVSTLPGGDGGLGSVYRIGWRGHAVKIATGFAQATNLAVSPDGSIYVVELGVGVFRATESGPVEVAALPGAAAVEWENGKLYASTAPVATGGSGAGRIVILG